MKKAEIGIIGLAVMGANLARNFESGGFTVAVYNRGEDKMNRFLSSLTPGRKFLPARTLPEFIDQLEKPRKILLMIQSGTPVDEMISALRPMLEPGDILMDGGNSRYADTIRRAKELEAAGISYLGVGISGGEEGALHGASIMAGGDPAAWEKVRACWEAAAAKVNGTDPCCALVGPGGSGHFVKMLHNGIEYADMQLIAEVYDLMRGALHMRPEEMSHQFSEWNKGFLNSYLVETAAAVLSAKDTLSTDALIDRIADRARQKGTGVWSAEEAFRLQVPASGIAEAVFARFASDDPAARAKASKLLAGPSKPSLRDRPIVLQHLKRAMFAVKICSYAQGFQILRRAANAYSWNLDYAAIARIWRGGCIIRARFLDDIADAFGENPKLDNLLLAPVFRSVLANAQDSWREIVSRAVLCGVPVPVMSGALAYYDSCRAEKLPANMIQALRDYFGAHTFERTDFPAGEYFHAEWSPSVKIIKIKR